ncbi:MAG: carbohydrate kinase [Lachnospiraceae bacterium]|nr:carbohydrate kinase [Lachnospiraceae bacterium]
MNKKYDVVALGELLIDFTENGISEQGNLILEANPGGAPCNVLAMVTKFGYNTAFIGKVGNDNFGRMLADTVAGVGINIDGLVFDDDVPTTLAFVHTKPDGDRSFSFYRNPGADVMLTKDDIPEELIKQSKIFHFGTLSMTHTSAEEATLKAVEIAKSNGLVISFDPNLRPPLWDDLNDAKDKMAYGMSMCDVLKISDNEIQFFTGEEDIDKGIEIIRSKYDIKLVCATLGKEGSVAYYGDKVIYGTPYVTDKTIETTGAGDTFMGCVLHSVLENGIDDFDEEKISRMLDISNHAASIITTRRGALRVMPEVSLFL